MAQRVVFATQWIKPLRLEKTRKLQHLAMHELRLVDAHGRGVPIDVHAAEIVCELGKWTLPSDEALLRLLALPVPVGPPGYTQQRMVAACEQLITEGQTIDVIGAKTRVASAEGAATFRETPWTIAIVAGELPVILLPR